MFGWFLSSCPFLLSCGLFVGGWNIPANHNNLKPMKGCRNRTGQGRAGLSSGEGRQQQLVLCEINGIKKSGTLIELNGLCCRLSPGFKENTSKLAGTTHGRCLLSFRSQLCLALFRCNPATVTPIAPLNKYSEVLTLPCLDSQAGSPDSRAARRRTYQHRPRCRNAAAATDPTVTFYVCVFKCIFTWSCVSVSKTQHTGLTSFSPRWLTGTVMCFSVSCRGGKASKDITFLPGFSWALKAAKAAAHKYANCINVVSVCLWNVEPPPV